MQNNNNVKAGEELGVRYKTQLEKIDEMVDEEQYLFSPNHTVN